MAYIEGVKHQYKFFVYYFSGNFAFFPTAAVQAEGFLLRSLLLYSRDSPRALPVRADGSVSRGCHEPRRNPDETGASNLKHNSECDEFMRRYSNTDRLLFINGYNVS